jgi:DNA-binding response OmpR family regulator
MPLIALIEDDPKIRVTLQIGLKSKGLQVRSFGSADEFMEKGEEFAFYDLFLVDLGLPRMSGELFCEKIRSKEPQKPVIVITARTEESTAVSIFAKGADDFVRKPFGLDELFARIQVALRRISSAKSVLRFEELVLNAHERNLSFRGQTVALTLRECEILELLFRHGGQVLTRERILSRIDSDGAMNDRTLDSHISNIRKKILQLGGCGVVISSVYGTGYRIEGER